MDEENSLVVYATGVCGLAAPIAMLLVVIVASLLSSGFDPAAHFVSVLGNGSGPSASVMNVLGFGLTGALIIVLAVGLFLSVGSRVAPRILLSAVVVIAGASTILLAVFPSDANADLNSMLSTVTGLALGLAPLIAAALFLRDGVWKRLGGPSLIAGLAALAFLAVAITNLIGGYTGLFQNLNLAIGLFWVGMCGLWMMRWS